MEAGGREGEAVREEMDGRRVSREVREDAVGEAKAVEEVRGDDIVAIACGESSKREDKEWLSDRVGLR